ncbi:MAG: DMT family transporter [Betaproteobacteria bacterium]|jgi:small multidrug resistance pump|nr:multidrug efflux SMR transporter [Rhodocyclaceae bacterium]MCA3134673.1 multidrug efflux SMR transporter [Rhodocyclaceae bacterium]MCA3143138.1 multidrug efflux SMR transporter [Rhodocyclaceae bacterium]MCA3144503.1 multidrug efflux SMR transporter [Rhodocyclaceae bacterium]MCE2898108.1 multidrug efflux SMR transporter [Betaproteobacteria bacterium]
MNHWVMLVGAIFFEVAGTICMKLSEGFTRPLPSVLIFLFYGVAFTLLTLALKKIDVSVAYAVWSAVGTAVIAGIGIVWFREPLTALKVASLLLIVAGMVGLNLGGASH